MPINNFYGLSLFGWLIILLLIVSYIFLYSREPSNIKPLIKEEFETKKVIKVYNFNTKWCGYSIRFQPEWDKFVKMIKSNTNVKCFDVKCDNDNNTDMCNKYNIEGFPTVIIEYNGEKHTYNEERTAEKLLETVRKLSN